MREKERESSHYNNNIATIVLFSTKRIAFMVVFDAILFTSTDRMYTSQEYIIFIV